MLQFVHLKFYYSYRSFYTKLKFEMNNYANFDISTYTVVNHNIGIYITSSCNLYVSISNK